MKPVPKTLPTGANSRCRELKLYALVMGRVLEHIVPDFVWNSGTLEVCRSFCIFHIDDNINKLGNSSEFPSLFFANHPLGTVPNAQ